MKKFAWILGLMTLIETASAQAEGIFAGLSIIWLLCAGAILLVSLACFALWIWMLIDCIKRDFKDKILWIVILLLTGILGAAAYYLLVKRKK